MSKRRDVGVTLIVGGVVIAVVATAMMLILPNIQNSTTLWLGDGVFQARIAKTGSARQGGLSNATKLDSNQALLMVFPSESKWQIGMKDMKIPIDIVWLDKDKKVIYIVKNASPDDSTAIFTPKSDARYVVELPAGTVSKMAITASRSAVFDVKEQGIQ
jgi:uncharacterized membrane protein (UPF0127 family)